MRAADFYTGLVAELYGGLKAHHQPAEPYAEFIRRTGEPALELGCGDGEPLLELLARGLDVDGIDSSADMLDRCRAVAGQRGLRAWLYCQLMEDLDLPRRYRSIFLAGPTINLLPDDATTARALRSIRRHLDPGGRALVPTFVPDAPTAADLCVPRQQQHGASLWRVTSLSAHRDETTRTQAVLLRYEKLSSGETEVVERHWVLHWHTREGFEALVAAAGLRVVAHQLTDGSAASPTAVDVTYLLARDDDR